MSMPIVTFLSLMNVIVFLMILGATDSAYSGPKEKKIQSQGTPVKVLSDKEYDDGVLAKGGAECVPKETGKAKKKLRRRQELLQLLG